MKKYIKIFSILLFSILLLTGCGNNSECEEWETVEKWNCEDYKKYGNETYNQCKEHNKSAGNKKCVKWKD